MAFSEYMQCLDICKRNLATNKSMLEPAAWIHYNNEKLSSEINPSSHIFKFHMITVNHTASILSKLKISKAAGYDNVPKRIVKDCADVILPIMTHLINRSLTSGEFPTSEKTAKISAVYKCDSESELGNYRPISILAVFSKIIEKVVHQQMTTHLESTNLISSTQFGFCRSTSTQHAVTYFNDHIRLHTYQILKAGMDSIYERL